MPLVISSAKNPTVQYLRQLWSSSSYRRNHEQTLAHGIHLVRSFLVSKQIPIRYVIAESALQNKEVKVLVQQLEPLGVQQVILTDSLYESLSDVHARVGISLVIPTSSQEANQLVGDAVLLDDIQDPGNIGTILRTAAVAGIVSAYCSSGCTSLWSPKALRAGMGAQFSMQLYERCDLESLIAHAQVDTYVTSLVEPNVSLYSLDLSAPAAWIFGNEGRGVSSRLQQLATRRVIIPQAVTAVESLNVAASTAVCLFEQYRQRIKQ
ncbi:MAG: RNA methyltransferase [Candidatus Saccharimonadales bacterium]